MADAMRQADFLYDIQQFGGCQEMTAAFRYCIRYIYMHNIEMLVSKPP